MKPIKIHILHCGRVRVDRALPFKEKTWHPAPFTGWFRSLRYQIWLPVSAYLIEHPKGLILNDTGWHTDVRTGQVRHLGFFHYSLNKADLPAGQAVSEQLAHQGIKTRDLDFVVLSHLHSDHASGLKLVKDAKNILVSEPEWNAANHKHKMHYIQTMWSGVNVKTFKFEDSELGPQHKSFDLFQDGSVQFVHCPGHTPGTAATFVQSNSRSLLLFSDIGYARKSWEEMIAPGVSVNKKQAMKSLEWVRRVSLQKDCIESLANHQADVIPHIIEL